MAEGSNGLQLDLGGSSSDSYSTPPSSPFRRLSTISEYTENMASGPNAGPSMTGISGKVRHDEYYIPSGDVVFLVSAQRALLLYYMP
jgi:hypothetical protein